MFASLEEHRSGHGFQPSCVFARHDMEQYKTAVVPFDEAGEGAVQQPARLNPLPPQLIRGCRAAWLEQAAQDHSASVPEDAQAVA